MPLCIDLCCGLGGWTEGFLAEGWDVIGFDIERHMYWTARPATESDPVYWDDLRRWQDDKSAGINSPKPKTTIRVLERYPAQLVLQDILTLHGRQLRRADCIVASPPCTEYSYMAMPWSRAKQIAAALRGQGSFPEGYTGSRTIPELRALFDACFRIQREACEAAGRHIPMVVENVKGAQPWVGKANANFGSFYFWGDVAMVGGAVVAGRLEFGKVARAAKRGAQKRNPDGTAHPVGSWFAVADSKERGVSGQKNDGGSWFAVANNTDSGHGQNPDGRKVASETGRRTDVGNGARFTSRDCGVESTARFREEQGTKQEGSGAAWFDSGICKHSSRSDSRNAASAQIAKIPFPLAGYIARQFKP